MKNKRQRRILEIVANETIGTQKELAERLQQEGFETTQATISRDIKELRLIKTQAPDGGYRYTTNAKNDMVDMSFKFHAIFAESVNSIDYAGNTIVIKCYHGMANAACAALDSIEWKGVVGTLAGDDTIFILMRDEASATEFVSQLKKLMKK